MQKLARIDLTRRESQIMGILHRRRRATVEEIRSELPDAPTKSSVRKLLDIMIGRHLLAREYDGLRYVYFPAATHEDASRSALKHLVRTFFNNSPSSAMAALLDMADAPLPEAEYKRLRALLTRARREGTKMTLLSWLIKASVLVFVAALIQAALGRRMSAAMRHVVWALTTVGLLLLPALSFTLPSWQAVPAETQRVVASLSQRVAPTSNAAIAEPSRSLSHDADLMLPWSIGLPAIYLVLVVFYATIVASLLARLALQRLAIRRLARRSTDVTDGNWMRLLAECAATAGARHPIRLLTSTEQPMPAMFGIRRPAILLPAGADHWSDDRRRAVLLHELAHVARYDCLWQALGAVACAIYWVHPGVWWIARRMRAERELACDDFVLSAGMSAYDYADHLLELAYNVPGHRMPAVAIEMASPRGLEQRLVALVDGTRPRAVPAMLTRLAVFALIVLIVAPISSAALRDGEVAQAVDDEQVNGLWEIRPGSAGFVEVRLCHADLFAHSEIPVRQVDGLSEAWLTGTNRPIRLTLRCDAGTFTLDGTVGRGNGSGTYAFVTDPRFPTDFESLGFNPPTSAMTARYPGLGTWAHTLALYDVGFDTLKTLRQQEGTPLAWSEFVRTKQFHTQFEAMQQAIARGPLRTSNWC